jgi:hypothetical protein
MFTSSRRAASARPRHDSKDKGIATLRIYNSADFPFGRIYEEAVLGAYKAASGSGAEPIIVTSRPDGDAPQQFMLSPQTRYVRHLGTLPTTLRTLLDDTEPGASFFIRDRKMLRLTQDQIKSAVFSNPVWVAEQLKAPRPTGVAPPIPSGAKMGRHSLFSDEAGDVAAILVEEDTLPLFDTQTERVEKGRPRF